VLRCLNFISVTKQMKRCFDLVPSEKITELQDQFNEYQTTPMEELSICTSDTDNEIFGGREC
jgi:hypothetical protein